jgi:hypothetical protein
MPFIGEHSGERVIPEEVEDGVDVYCPVCNAMMRPRGPFDDGRARHFFHVTATDCGGESDHHRKLKSMVVSALRQEYTDTAADIALELSMDSSETLTVTNRRQADVCITFDQPNEFFGKGIVVEVQYQNENKDAIAATHDYLANGYSVFWASEQHFTDSQFKIEEMLDDFNANADSAYATRHTGPICGMDKCRAEYDYVQYILTESRNTVVHYSDPNPDCQHDWVSHMHQEKCYRCNISRVDTAISGLEIYYGKSNRDSRREYDIKERGEKPTDHEHYWRGKRSTSEGELLECECGAKRTHRRDESIIDHGPQATWDVTTEALREDEEHMPYQR